MPAKRLCQTCGEKGVAQRARRAQLAAEALAAAAAAVAAAVQAQGSNVGQAQGGGGGQTVAQHVPMHAPQVGNDGQQALAYVQQQIDWSDQQIQQLEQALAQNEQEMAAHHAGQGVSQPQQEDPGPTHLANQDGGESLDSPQPPADGTAASSTSTEEGAVSGRAQDAAEEGGK